MFKLVVSALSLMPAIYCRLCKQNQRERKESQNIFHSQIHFCNYFFQNKVIDVGCSNKSLLFYDIFYCEGWLVRVLFTKYFCGAVPLGKDKIGWAFFSMMHLFLKFCLCSPRSSRSSSRLLWKTSRLCFAQQSFAMCQQCSLSHARAEDDCGKLVSAGKMLFDVIQLKYPDKDKIHVCMYYMFCFKLVRKISATD